MGLQAKFNLAMVAAFAIGLALAAALSWGLARDNARRDVLRQAALMTSEGAVISAYTREEVQPLLKEASLTKFLPQSIPFGAVGAHFRRLQKELPDYSYRSTALNPTNLADRSTDWETDIIQTFRHDEALKQFVTEHRTPAGLQLAVARPIRITDGGCLTCHSTPAAAPASMVALYGPSNGFGWKMGETIGAQIVSVPMAVPLERARQAFLASMGALVVVFAVMLVLLNVLLRLFIVQPVRRIAGMADQVSLGQLDTPEYTVNSRDEIGSLAASFNRMRRSLVNAMRMLDD